MTLFEKGKEDCSFWCAG